jgi:Lrp/AsnC family transcriptional regulator, leucine-responsive regulatory protein
MAYNRNIDIDQTDADVLRLLGDNARASMSDIARAIGMSAPGATERVRRLEAAGVIRGYTINVNAEALGFGITAIVRIKPRLGQLHVVAQYLQDAPMVVACDKVTGEDCFVARLALRAISELDPFIDPLHLKAETSTSIVTASPVDRRMPPIGPPPGPATAKR